jgi:hypothetical protein
MVTVQQLRRSRGWEILPRQGLLLSSPSSMMVIEILDRCHNRDRLRCWIHSMASKVSREPPWLLQRGQHLSCRPHLGPSHSCHFCNLSRWRSKSWTRASHGSLILLLCHLSPHLNLRAILVVVWQPSSATISISKITKSRTSLCSLACLERWELCFQHLSWVYS